MVNRQVREKAMYREEEARNKETEGEHRGQAMSESSIASRKREREPDTWDKKEKERVMADTQRSTVRSRLWAGVGCHLLDVSLVAC